MVVSVFNAVGIPGFLSLASVATGLAPRSDCMLITPSGTLQGFFDPTRSLCNYRGIPFAKPPLGDLRWRSPVPHGPWQGILNATAFGSICIQSPESWNTVENKDKMSEDCLFLNVVAPPRGAEPSRPLPVVVYFHAGEFSIGATCDLESDQPWSDDVVLVTSASRLGVMGYLGAADLRGRTADGSTGSYGVEDQREALRWVQANIAAFGGNASNVAIMGESSGGAAVGVHLILDKSWGLFHKAIGESPGLTQVKSLEDAELNYQYVLGALLALKSPGCVHEDNDEASYATFEHTELRMSDYGPRGPSSSVLETHVGWDYKQAAAACDALPNCHGFNILVAAANTTVYLVNTTKLYDVTVRSALPAGQSVTAYLKAAAGGAKGVQCLVQADAKVLMQGINSFAPRADTFQTDTWAPVLDGVAFKRSIIDSIAAGNVAPGVPLLAGSNMDEGTIFMSLVPTIRCNASADDFLAWANAFYGPTLGPLVPPAYTALRQPVPRCQSQGPGPPGDGKYYMAAMRSAGDFAITCAVRTAAQQIQQRGGRVFTYYFTHQPIRSDNYQGLDTLGAFHGAEVPFAFGYQPELSNDAERTLAKQMGCYWRNFVWTGDPNAQPVGGTGPCSDPASFPTGLPTWPRFVAGPQEQTMVLDVGKVAPEAGLSVDTCDVFKKVKNARSRVEVPSWWKLVKHIS